MCVDCCFIDGNELDFLGYLFEEFLILDKTMQKWSLFFDDNFQLVARKLSIDTSIIATHL